MGWGKVARWVTVILISSMVATRNTGRWERITNKQAKDNLPHEGHEIIMFPWIISFSGLRFMAESQKWSPLELCHLLFHFSPEKTTHKQLFSHPSIPLEAYSLQQSAHLSSAINKMAQYHFGLSGKLWHKIGSFWGCDKILYHFDRFGSHRAQRPSASVAKEWHDISHDFSLKFYFVLPKNIFM